MIAIVRSKRGEAGEAEISVKAAELPETRVKVSVAGETAAENDNEEKN